METLKTIKGYVLYWDNGLSYDDSNRYYFLTVKSEEVAKEEVKKLIKWRKEGLNQEFPYSIGTPGLNFTDTLSFFAYEEILIQK